MKKIIVMLLIGLSVGFAKAQELEFDHAIGASYLYAFGNGEGVNSTVGITYAPRILIRELSKESGITLNITPTLAFAGEFDSRDGGSGSFGYELPVSVNYNFGHRATSSSRKGFGGFVGLGYGLTGIRNISQSSLLGVSELSSNVRGIYGELGARFKVHTKAMKRRRIGAKSVGINIYSIAGGDRGNIAGIRFLVGLG